MKANPAKGSSGDDHRTAKRSEAPSGSQRMYERHLAKKIADVRRLRADVSLALVNSQRRGESVLTHADLLAKARIFQAADVGTRLLAVLQPKYARRRPTGAELAQAMDERDRLWTLFEHTWEQEVWRAGAWIFGRAVDTHVPSLHSRVVGKRPPKAAPQPVAGP